MNPDRATEQHPWQPFLPYNAKILFLGTFPPKQNKWGMDFYYPNKINDFWRIMGLIFHHDINYYFDIISNRFNKEKIIEDMTLLGIGLGDTALEVRRLKDNASDKYLEIVKPLDLIKLLNKTPHCDTVVTTGQKAAEVIASLTGTNVPQMGECTSFNQSPTREIQIFRMPSTSRAYPLPLNKKADFYKNMLKSCGIL